MGSGLRGGLGGGWEGLISCNTPQFGVGEFCPTSSGATPWSMQRSCTICLNGLSGFIRWS